MIGLLEASLEESPSITVTSPDATDGRLPDWTGFINDNENPALELDGVPTEAASLFLEVVHLEAADVVDHPWIHWLVWGIDPERTDVPRGWSPAGATEGYNDFLEQGWGGPSPPPEQDELYRFRVYALDVDPDLPPHSRRARVASTIGLEGEVLASGEFTARYSADQGTVFTTEGARGLRPGAD